MTGIRVNANGSATERLAELNHHTRVEQKEVRDGVTGDGQGLSEEDESRVNEVAEANCGRKDLVQPQSLQQRLQQHPQGPQGPMVCWERFLPLRSLKVLLVENDDSTRHVVSALLRNCSYNVVAVANGLEAWKILEDLTNRIDLVLTEVVMPLLSGIGLLYKVMSHKTCKNIPVIMMSSNDSMGIVFKCLSKGAVDFLVKPIRKNELKNLWQHVWRKCHSSSGSGSGSESGTRTQKSIKSKSVEGSDDNNATYAADDNASISLNIRDGSDNGSGTQSSWTKRAVEVDSPQSISPWDQVADPPESTCAQVIQSRPETLGNNLVPTTATRKFQEQDDDHGNAAMGKDLEIGVPGNPDFQLEYLAVEVLDAVPGTNKEQISDSETKNDGEKLDREKVELNSEIPDSELRKEAADLIGAITNSTNIQMESVPGDVPINISRRNNKDTVIFDNKDIPSLELSLKRRRDDGETETDAHERNILRHSNLSPFLRYNTSSTVNQAPIGNVGSSSLLDNSSEAGKEDSLRNLQSNSNGTPNQGSNGSSNGIDMGSTTNNAFTKQSACSDKPISKAALSIHPCSAFQPVANGHVSSLQPVKPGQTDTAKANSVHVQARDLQPQVQVQARGMQPQVQVQHHHHHYHHHHHHVHNMPQRQKQLPSHDDLSLKTPVVSAPHRGQPNLTSMPIEGNAANNSLSGSASGSNNGNNEQKGSYTDVINNVETGQCGGGPAAATGSGSGSGSGVVQNRFSQREAALNKFRLKRKERCFEKKVRYQSRKKLAEQRPRVRGQFVRRVDKSKDGVC